MVALASSAWPPLTAGAVPAGAPPGRLDGDDASVALAGIVNRARLANDCHFDLAWVLQALLDLLRDVAGEAGGAKVVDGVGGDEDAMFATGLVVDCLLDAV